jgi:hypothetical protein
MGSRTPWTNEEVKLLADLVSRHASLNVIALKIGRSVAAIEAKAAQQGIAITRVKRAYRRRDHDLRHVGLPRSNG